MTLNKIKQMKKDRGFTIVELLIVIVIIAILAAITIVAYSGITARANDTKAQTNGASAQKVAETYNADFGSYPATAALLNSGCVSPCVASSKMPSGVTAVFDAGTPPATTAITASNGLTNVGWACLTTCTNPTGGRISYWKFSTSTIQFIYVGAATSGGTFVYPSS